MPAERDRRPATAAGPRQPESADQAVPGVAFPPRPGTRLLVLGYLLLWLLESAGQALQLFWFLLRHRRVRERFHRIIGRDR